MTSASASVSHAASSPPLSHQQLAASTKASAAAASTSAVAAAVPAQSRLSVSSASRPRSSAAFASPTATFPAASAPASASASASASTRRSSPSRTVTLAAAPVVAPTGRSSLPLSPSATNRSRSDLTLRSDATDATDAAASPAAVATTTPTAITPSSLSQKRLLPASSPTVAATAPRPALLPSTQTNAQTTSATESNADMPTLTPVAPAKRGRGRPRKRDTAAAGQPGVEPAVKRGPGRPRKIPIEPVAQDLKPAAMLEVTPVKRGPGRPRKVVEPSQVVIKASPPLSASTAAPVAVPDAVPVKRGPGRPRKIVPTVQPAPSTAKIAGVPGASNAGNAGSTAGETAPRPRRSSSRSPVRPLPFVPIAPKPSLMDKGKERVHETDDAAAMPDQTTAVAAVPLPEKRGRGRPRKNPISPSVTRMRTLAPKGIPLAAAGSAAGSAVEQGSGSGSGSGSESGSTRLAAHATLPHSMDTLGSHSLRLEQSRRSRSQQINATAYGETLLDINSVARDATSNPASALVDFLEHPDDHTFNSLVKSLHHLELDTTIILTLLNILFPDTADLDSIQAVIDDPTAEWTPIANIPGLVCCLQVTSHSEGIYRVAWYSRPQVAVYIPVDDWDHFIYTITCSLVGQDYTIPLSQFLSAHHVRIGLPTDLPRQTMVLYSMLYDQSATCYRPRSIHDVLSVLDETANVPAESRHWLESHTTLFMAMGGRPQPPKSAAKVRSDEIVKYLVLCASKTVVRTGERQDDGAVAHLQALAALVLRTLLRRYQEASPDGYFAQIVGDILNKEPQTWLLSGTDDEPHDGSDQDHVPAAVAQRSPDGKQKQKQKRQLDHHGSVNATTKRSRHANTDTAAGPSSSSLGMLTVGQRAPGQSSTAPHESAAVAGGLMATQLRVLDIYSSVLGIVHTISQQVKPLLDAATADDGAGDVGDGAVTDIEDAVQRIRAQVDRLARLG
ncbi:hypothetical protein BC831DRAFT_490652 [Entophlyctis helioformis]|nr:hypothetical protein BC831DRAFT_490652 [Entophlyctis helioformis]